jgi:hypothetical protein
VVIDTWPKFRPFLTRGRSNYEEDYEHAGELKATADKYGIAILALVHCRKMGASDPIDEVSGTLGLTGAADGVLVLKRQRGQNDATLFVTGRDLDERDIALRWESECAQWSIMGDAADYQLNKKRQEIVDLLLRHPTELTPSQAAGLLGKPVNRIKWLMWQMAKDGQLSVAGGRYTVTNSANPLTAVANP